MAGHTHFEVFVAANGQYFWHLQVGNNRLIADSGETYKNKSDCLEMLAWLKASMATFPIEDQTGTPRRWLHQ